MVERIVRAPMASTVVDVLVARGASVSAGQAVVIVEAMKMEHELCAGVDGTVAELLVQPGDAVDEGDVLVRLQARAARDGAGLGAQSPGAVSPAAAAAESGVVAAMNRIVGNDGGIQPQAAALRADLRDLQQRLAFTTRCGAAGGRGESARQGPAHRAREHRRPLRPGLLHRIRRAGASPRSAAGAASDDLLRNTPADGMVTGIGSVNGELYRRAASRCVVMAYDATVLAGTQGLRNHQKTDRLLGVALKNRLPVVLFAEGGGGRPGDTDMPIVAGLHVHTFASFARLNGQVPVVGIVAGRCFAGNAALLGLLRRDHRHRAAATSAWAARRWSKAAASACSARSRSARATVQHANGVIDVLVDDEAAGGGRGAALPLVLPGRARRPGTRRPAARCATWCRRTALRVYDSRAALRRPRPTPARCWTCAPASASGIHTALGRIDGRPVGLLASNPLHLGGAIDADAADKAARFMQLCNAHGLPLVSLVDTPGFMVGPAIEEQAQVRHVSRMFVAAAHLRVPFFSVVLRKGYGLGAMAMAAGGFHAPESTVAWPSGEFGGMGLEGAVRLGYRKELEAVPEGPQREALFEQLVARQYASGTGDEHGGHAGDRCGHRPGRDAELARPGTGIGPRGTADRAVCRYLVMAFAARVPLAALPTAAISAVSQPCSPAHPANGATAGSAVRPRSRWHRCCH